jgi:hypothetical protein
MIWVLGWEPKQFSGWCVAVSIHKICQTCQSWVQGNAPIDDLMQLIIQLYSQLSVFSMNIKCLKQENKTADLKYVIFTILLTPMYSANRLLHSNSIIISRGVH